MAENMNGGFRLFYDEEEDILTLAKEGEEEEVVEVSPGVNMEFDRSGNAIGLEIFKASTVFKDVLDMMKRKLLTA
jgi:uncharacterized protein YuzE